MPELKNNGPRGAKAETPVGNPPAAARATVPFVIHYLSALLDRPVRYEGEARPFGRLRDIGASRSASLYPQAVCLKVAVRRAGDLVLPWSAVKTLAPQATVVARAPSDTAAPAPAFWLRRDVLDDQVVDVSGARVLRVNDVHLIYSDKTLLCAHAEIGTLGIIRRLGLERPVRFLLRWLFDYTLKESFVTWRQIEVISPGGVPGGLRVARLPHRLTEIHPAELADIMEELGAQDRQRLFRALPVDTAAETLEAVTPEHQRTLIVQEEPGRVADILEEMPSQGAADVLRDIAASDAQPIINQMEREAAADVRQLLAQDELTAGSVMESECFTATAEETVAVIMQRLREAAPGAKIYHYVYVLDGQRHIAGVLGLWDLLRAPPEARADGLMDRHVVAVPTQTGMEELETLFTKYGYRALPVVDAGDRFLGAVSFRSASPAAIAPGHV